MSSVRGKKHEKVSYLLGSVGIGLPLDNGMLLVICFVNFLLFGKSNPRERFL